MDNIIIRHSLNKHFGSFSVKGIVSDVYVLFSICSVVKTAQYYFPKRSINHNHINKSDQN